MAERDDASLIGYDPLAWLQKPDTDLSADESASDQVIEPVVEGIESLNISTATEHEAHDGLELSVSKCVDHFDADQNQSVVEYATSGFSDNHFDEGVLTNAEHTSAEANPLKTAIVLDSVQNIQTVATLYQRLVNALDDSDRVEIDVSAVSQIDTSTLQLLLVFKRSAVKRNKEVTFDFPSERFIEAASLLGLTEILDLDHAPAGLF